MIVNKFEEQAEIYSEHLAIKTADKQLTYQQLNCYANGIAYKIIDDYKETFTDHRANTIALLFEHGTDMIVATIAALKAEKTYVPFDSNYPKNRLVYMLEDSEAKLIVTNSRNLQLAKSLIEGRNDISILNIDDIYYSDNLQNINRSTKEHDIAYILYTSGSTGKPKGVIQSHRNILHFISCYTKDLQITSKDKITLFSAYSHDASIMDMYGALLNGATLYPVNIKEQVGINKLAAWLQEEEITIYHSVPTVYRYFIDTLAKEEFPLLRYIVLGGEGVIEYDVEMFKKHFKTTKLVNLYGQTESSYNSCQIFSANSEKEDITLGEPVDYTEIIVVDENREEVLPLRVGEIVILSDHVALGYWKDEEKTNKVFEYSPEGNLYWTGDLGRLLGDGSVQFVGRKDSQVKIRGFRVETGEIETNLLKHEDVDQCVVLGRKDLMGNDYLCGYIVANRPLTADELKGYLADKLPDYMIPSSFVQLDKMPLTPSNKVDTKSLLSLEESMGTSTKYEAPTNPIQEKLVDIWLEILKVDKVGINDNFFDLGGHSLKMTSLVSKIHREFNAEITLAGILKMPTIKEISEHIDKMGTTVYEAIEAIEEADYYTVSSAQRRMFLLNQLNPSNTSYNMSLVLKVEGKINREKIEKALQSLVERHECLRTTFQIEDGEIVQIINAGQRVKATYANGDEKDIDQLINSFIQPFDLTKGPLLRLEVVELSQENHLLMFDIHHIISDGVSMGILTEEFLSLYQGKILEPLKLQYKDYAVWEKNLLKSEAIKKQEAFWLEMFKDEAPRLNMPLDFPRPEKPVLKGKRIKFDISEEIIRGISQIARREGTTLNTVLYSIYALLLSKYSGQDDITVGVVVAARRHYDLSRMIGAFINFIPIRNKIDPNSTFREFLQLEKSLMISAYDHQDYPFEELVERVSNGQDVSRNPMFDSMFVLHNQHEAHKEYQIEDLKFQEVQIKRNTSKLDFQLDAYVDYEGNLKCSLEYNTNLFEEKTMTAFIKHYKLLMENVIANDEAVLSDMKIFDDGEWQTIEKKRENNEPRTNEKSIVVTATFTSEPIAQHVTWWCRQFNEEIALKFAPYNQVFQQLLDPSSLVSKNRGLNLVLVRFEDWIRDIKSEDERIKVLESNFNSFISALESQGKDSSYLIGIFPVSTHLGLSKTIIEYIQGLNDRLKTSVSSITNIYLMDFTQTHKNYRIGQIFDEIKDKAGHIPFTEEYFAAIGTTIARKICGMVKPPFKVMVLDCDNTLWKGICGEEGALGVTIDEGHRAFQELLLQKKDEGMLLALCSKNNENDALEVFEKNPDMLLKKEDFVSWKINWRNKGDNIKELAQELDLSTNSFIFVDDSYSECSQVMMTCPEVLTLQLPSDSSLIPMYMKHVWALDREKITNEDKNRTEVYKAQKQRKDLLDSKDNIWSFLESLQLKLFMNQIKDKDLSRASQLTQRTNQFNSSTIRRTEEEIRQLISNPNYICWKVRVEDRFGDYGVVGLIIGEKKEKALVIDTFLLSCRVLGKRIEEAILIGLHQYCQKDDLETILLDFKPTAKNMPFVDFLENTKWDKFEENGELVQYQLPLHNIEKSIEFIEGYYDEEDPEEDQEISGEGAEEVATTLDLSVNSTNTLKEEFQLFNWNVELVNEENLTHRGYLLALTNYTGEKLMQLPVKEKERSNSVVKEEYVAPSNDIEEKLVNIWCDILKVEEIGINDHFFSLGGHSLNAVNLVSRIHKVFNVEIQLSEIFKTPILKELAEYIAKSQNTTNTAYSSIKSVEAEERTVCKASSAQKRMFVLNQFNDKDLSYNITDVLRVNGRLEKDKVQNIFNKLVERHESLRTSFELLDGEVLQKIQKDIDFKIEFEEVEGASEELIKEIVASFVRPFDLSKAPLIRVKLLRTDEKRHILMVDLHHIIADGASKGILMKEFIRMYKGEVL